MMSGNNNLETSCYTCHEDPVPIMRFIDSNSKNQKTYNVLIGCSTGHLTPFTIKSDSQSKLLIRKDESILGGIKRFEKDYEKVILFFKSDKSFKETYNSIIKSIISDDQKGAIIHNRYFMEIHQKITFFGLVILPNEDQETKWSKLKGSKLYDRLISQNRGNKRWYKSLDDEKIQFLESNQKNITDLKGLYQKFSSQLHYFTRDKRDYSQIPKKEWATSEVKDKFVEFLKISTNIMESQQQLESKGEI